MSRDFGIRPILRGDLRFYLLGTTICCVVPKHLLVGQSCEVMTYEVFSRQKKVLHCLQAWDLVDSRLRMSCGQWKMSQNMIQKN